MESRDSTLDAAGVRAALDAMTRNTLLAESSRMLLSCLHGEGRARAEPAFVKRIRAGIRRP